MLCGWTLRAVSRLSAEVNSVYLLSVVQEIYLTKEEAIADKVDHTYLDPLTNLYEVECASTVPVRNRSFADNIKGRVASPPSLPC